MLQEYASLVADYNGWSTHLLSITNLHLLQPSDLSLLAPFVYALGGEAEEIVIEICQDMVAENSSPFLR